MEIWADFNCDFIGILSGSLERDLRNSQGACWGVGGKLSSCRRNAAKVRKGCWFWITVVEVLNKNYSYVWRNFTEILRIVMKVFGKFQWIVNAICVNFTGSLRFVLPFRGFWKCLMVWWDSGWCRKQFWLILMNLCGLWKCGLKVVVEKI